MNRFEASLRLWKEARPTGSPEAQLNFFRYIRERIEEIPEGADLAQVADVIVRLKSWIPGLTVQGALELVHHSVLQGQDPSLIEEALKFVKQANGGFARVDLARFIFQYTLPQIRSAKSIWDMLPMQDRTLIQADAILELGLEDQTEVVTLLLQELQSLQGDGLKVAAVIKDCLSPVVAFELWRNLRRAGPIQPTDLSLVAKATLSVGMRGSAQLTTQSTQTTAMFS